MAGLPEVDVVRFAVALKRLTVPQALAVIVAAAPMTSVAGAATTKREAGAVMPIPTLPVEVST